MRYTETATIENPDTSETESGGRSVDGHTPVYDGPVQEQLDPVQFRKNDGSLKTAEATLFFPGSVPDAASGAKVTTTRLDGTTETGRVAQVRLRSILVKYGSE